jgi:hypothetical protein
MRAVAEEGAVVEVDGRQVERAADVDLDVGRVVVREERHGAVGRHPRGHEAGQRGALRGRGDRGRAAGQYGVHGQTRRERDGNQARNGRQQRQGPGPRQEEGADARARRRDERRTTPDPHQHQEGKNRHGDRAHQQARGPGQ